MNNHHQNCAHPFKVDYAQYYIDYQGNRIIPEEPRLRVVIKYCIHCGWRDILGKYANLSGLQTNLAISTYQNDFYPFSATGTT